MKKVIPNQLAQEYITYCESEVVRLESDNKILKKENGGLAKFLNQVANKLNCLPSYCSPSLDDGNAHIGRKIDSLQADNKVLTAKLEAIESEHQDAMEVSDIDNNEIAILTAKVKELEDKSIPIENGSNRYGLDIGYFRKTINRELNHSLKDYMPDELARVLARLSVTADKDVIFENEFQKLYRGK